MLSVYTVVVKARGYLERPGTNRLNRHRRTKYLSSEMVFASCLKVGSTKTGFFHILFNLETTLRVSSAILKVVSFRPAFQTEMSSVTAPGSSSESILRLSISS